MDRRILAAVLSILLAVSLVLTLPVTAKAETWDETIAHYDSVFAVIDGDPEMKFPELYTALLLDPEMFVSQLAFRHKEVKEYALQVLTGDWVSPEQWFNIQEALNSVETDFEAEKLLVRDIKDYHSYLSYQDVGIVTDCKALFDQVLTADGFYATDLAYDLAYAFIGTPETFILELSEEEKDVQDRVSLLLQEHQYSFLGTKIYESIPAFIPDLKPEDMYILGVIIAAAQNYPRIYQQTDPYPEALKQWKEAGLTPPVFTAYNYDRLFDFSLGERTATLAEALLNDTANFVNELAFRDVATKNKVLNAFETAELSDLKLKQMYLRLQTYQHSAALTKSETDLLDVLMCHLDTTYYSRPHPHRDCQTLFAAALDVTAKRLETFVDEIRFAFIEDPKYFIDQLVLEEENVQQKVIDYLMTNARSSTRFQPIAAQVDEEYSHWVRSPDYYSDQAVQLLLEIKLNITTVLIGPQPTDPDPEEYAQWLKDKGLLVDDPGVVLPIRPTETQPATLPTETQPTAGEDPKKDTGWVSTICFTLGFLCIGIATGSVIAKKKKAKKAAQAEKQAAAEVPVKVYPKLLYCPAPLSRETQKQISQVLREKYDEYSVHWYSIKQTDGTCRCYGTEGGYDILFYAGGLRMEIPASCTVGSCTFSFATEFELYAHKDGQLTDLNTALEQGLISQQAVLEALNKHKSITK